MATNTDDLLERTLRLLRTRLTITAADIADGLGVSLSTISHLQQNLRARSPARRQAAERLRDRILLQARSILAPFEKKVEANQNMPQAKK